MKNFILTLVMLITGLTTNSLNAQGSWTLQTNPTSDEGESMQFVSATEGWIGLNSGQLLHTTNAGQTWNIITPTDDMVGGMDAPGSRISFIDATTGWIMKSSADDNENFLGTNLYKTTNGGSTWTRTILSTNAGDAGIQVQFVDANNGWVLIYNMDTSTPIFKRTTDGGATWTTTNGGGIFYYVNENVGYAFSAGPQMPPPYTIFKTTDGGTNWTPQYVDNTSGELNAIQFTDVNNGWIVGNNGKIFKTTDGGANWIPITNTGFNANYDYNPLSFINSTTGWIGARNNSNGSHFTLSTTDGGATWSTQTITICDDVFSMCFWDANHGWATSDSGAIAKYSISNGPYSNATLNGPWFLYSDVTPIDPYNDNLLYLVFDGNGNVTDNSGFAGLFTGNYIVNASGEIAVKITNGSECFLFGGQLTSTTEGTAIVFGQNWRLHKIANPGALTNKIVGTLSTPNCGSKNVTLNIDSNGLIISATGLEGPVVGRIYADLGVYVGHMTTGEPNTAGWHEFSIWGYYNNNNLTGTLGLESQTCSIGATSNLVRSDNPPINTNWIPNTSLTGAGFESVTFINTNLGYIVGSSGRIFKTIDGGENWTQQNSGTTSNLTSVKFPDNNVGYVVGYDGVILKTTDGGTNWVTLTSGTIQKLYSVFFTDSNTGYAVGKSGIMIKTTNGGNSWTTMTSGANDSLNSIYFINSNTGYAVGSNGTILKTTNAGANWITQRINFGEKFLSCYFMEDNSGFAVGLAPDGVNGVIFKTTTTNPGVWTQQNSVASVGLNSINFYQNVGYIVGANGTILKTTDNGTTWTAQASGVINGLYSICFTSINTSYAVGDGGIILKTTNGGGSLGLTEVPIKNKIVIYPNPNDGLFCFDIKEPLARLQIEIYNHLGQKVFEASNFEMQPQNEINFTPQSKGIYLIKITDGENSYSEKIMIK